VESGRPRVRLRTREKYGVYGERRSGDVKPRVGLRAGRRNESFVST
jgi:hypothetical protein